MEKTEHLLLQARHVLRTLASMKMKFVVLLLLLNVAAVAAGYVLFGEYWGGQTEKERETTQVELAAWKARAAAPEPSSPAEPLILYQTNDFHWSQLESTNYRQFIANLRAVDCPESTIKDIIITDVMRLYAQRRGQYYHNGRPFRYWETNDKRKLTEPQIEERDRQLAQIDKDLPAVLRQLLGINYERELNKYFVDADEEGRRLAFLSEDQRTKVLSLREQFEGEREQILYNLQNGKPLPSEIEQLRQIDQSQDEALAQVLSPQEKELYELSTSATADRLRQQWIGFNPTEQEFRDLYQRQKAIDDAYEFEDTNDTTVIAAKASDEAEMMKAFKANLVGDRVAQLDRSQDPDYQNLCLLSQRYELPADASDALLDMRLAAEEARHKLLSNNNIPPDRVEAALQSIEAETEKAARQTLGEKAFAQYSQSAAWIKNLGTNGWTR
jgi:hypothetical protein